MGPRFHAASHAFVTNKAYSGNETLEFVMKDLINLDAGQVSVFTKGC
jgi:hypothetical protein